MFAEMINVGPPKLVGAEIPKGPDPNKGEDASSFEAALSPKMEKDFQKSIPEKTRGGPKKEEILKEFMDSFESEFKVPVARLVEGIQSQSENSVGVTVEASALKAVKQLGLSKEDQERASLMVLALIQNLKGLTPQENSLDPLGKGLSPLTLGMLQRVNDEKQHREILHKNLDSLQTQFWPKPVPLEKLSEVVDVGFDQDFTPEDAVSEDSVAGLLSSESADLTSPDPEVLDANPKVEGLEKFEIKTPKFFESQSPKGVLTPVKLAGIMSFGLNQRKLAEELPKYDENVLPLYDKKFTGISNVPGQKISEPSLSALKNLTSSSLQTGPAAAALGLISKQEKSDLSQESGGDQGSEDSASGDSFSVSANQLEGPTSFFPGMAALKALDSVSRDSKASISEGPSDFQVSDSQVEANIKRVLTQANFLIRNGGGEMKVQLNPEGLGEMRLKVAVNNGEVGIQMLTSSQEAKKMIEGGFSELKKSLADHSLNMGTVKVDVVSALSTDVATQGGRSGFDSQQSSQQDPRQGAQQFWSQFHQNFGSAHQQGKSYTENRWDINDSSPKTRPLEPVTTGGTNKKRVSGHKGSGLNMVA